MNKSNPIKSICLFLFLSIGFYHPVLAQSDTDKCGRFDPALEQDRLQILGDHWGYGYDDLMDDLSKWEMNSMVSVQPIGNSVLGRPLWELKITDRSIPDDEKQTIYIHTRTHPGEVQSTWVTNSLIEFLLSDQLEAEILKRHCIFYILPMYNPDGVELEYPRENANNIDLESNWFSTNIQPEVLALEARFSELMTGEHPITLALNMHSAYACKRYFVYHHENGTSADFTAMEKEFISAVRNEYPDGIEPWNYYISWSNGTPLKYPESWWWVNYEEAVLALTYEDMNCEEAGNFDKTAQAILRGIAEYFSIDLTQTISIPKNEKETNFVCFPNPASNKLKVWYTLHSPSDVTIRILNSDGEVLQSSLIQHQDSQKNSLTIPLDDYQNGTYYCQIITDLLVLVHKVVIINN